MCSSGHPNVDHAPAGSAIPASGLSSQSRAGRTESASGTGPFGVRARRRAVVAVPFEDEPTPAWGHVRTFDRDDPRALGAATGLPFTVTEHHGGWLVIDIPR
jgi:hypothetical protein